MDRNKVVVNGTGCALGDYIYNNISFDAPEFIRYLSRMPGDGGLSPGKLVFADDLQREFGENYKQIIQNITRNRLPDGFNAGGPSLVSLVHASQLGETIGFDVNFYGVFGDDETGKILTGLIHKTPLDISNCLVFERDATPFTLVLSDPDYYHGTGERTFINHLGVAKNFSSTNLSEKFFDADITCFGGTALVPGIHDDLTSLLQTAKENHCITVVNTVYDFRAEKANPGKPWPLVSNPDKYSLIDVLIMDMEEAIRISGRNNIYGALDFLVRSGVGSFLITNGVMDMLVYSRGNLFREIDITSVPVSKKLLEDNAKKQNSMGDTTGCGDNFAGGIIAYLAWQIAEEEQGQFEILQALSWGAASGGWALNILGGVYLEKYPGEKLEMISRFRNYYYKDLSGL